MNVSAMACIDLRKHLECLRFARQFWLPSRTHACQDRSSSQILSLRRHVHHVQTAREMSNRCNRLAGRCKIAQVTFAHGGIPSRAPLSELRSTSFSRLIASERRRQSSRMRVQTIKIISGCLLAASLLACCVISLSPQEQLPHRSRYYSHAMISKLQPLPKTQALTGCCCCRNLLSFWDEQHPDADTPFKWIHRNILAIPAACVVRLASHTTTKWS